MKYINDISEKYCKFLLEIVFAEQKYYTVFGADISDNDIDKLLVNADGSLLLFSTPVELLSLIKKNNSFFDNEALQEWAREINGINESYAVISFDVLSKDITDLNDLELFKSIYHTLGIVEDYSKQINDERLLALCEQGILVQFVDDLADYFTWSENKVFTISVDIDILSLHLKGIYERLKERVKTYHL
ncbi:hypothetical protein AB6805_03375 [Chitinophaga sp. RCC_12]|uniref:hypothetical protein n=1 Tax=Chitinophaga sp. RCC_12 TaxID=3239226 RepID=UPI0035258D72